MFSGKTTALINRLQSEQNIGKNVAAAKPALDDRYHPTALSTHDGGRFDATTIESPQDLLQINADLLGLDECHFFDQGLHDTVLTLLSRGTHLVLSGLDRTSLNEPFHEMGLLLVEADEIIKLTAPCAICGLPAVHTIRLFDSTAPIVVGGQGMFENRCRTHLHNPKPTLKSLDELPPDAVR
jgi:thymidine kinase